MPCTECCCADTCLCTETDKSELDLVWKTIEETGRNNKKNATVTPLLDENCSIKEKETHNLYQISESDEDIGLKTKTPLAEQELSSADEAEDVGLTMKTLPEEHTDSPWDDSTLHTNYLSRSATRATRNGSREVTSEDIGQTSKTSLGQTEISPALDGSTEDVGLTTKATPSDDEDPASCVRETASPAARIDRALHTLKSELMAMRQQDLQLLKQLIHINDNIRRLKRTRWLRDAGRTASCGVLGARAAPSSSQGQVSGGKERTSVLLRQRSEPGMMVLPRRLSALTSASSIDTIADMEEADSLYGSATDLDDPDSPPPVAAATTPGMRRSSSAFAALTFTPEELRSGGESSYGEILKRNVRLWKWSVARERDSGLDGQLMPCVL